MKRMSVTIVAMTALALAAGHALASGMLIPKDTSLPPLAIRNQRVDIRIKDGVATAKVEQVFRNSTGRELEAVYVFPLPENAVVADFAMMINGKRQSGELVEKGEARRIYQDIVRRLKDPGLLEYMGGGLFRISVYPVPKNGDLKVELVYSQTLGFEAGLYRYVYPLKTGERASRTLEDFTVSAQIVSRVPIKTVYSPSHEVGISRKGDHEATLGFEEERALLDRDFVLYYGVSDKAFGLNLLTHAEKGQDGYYMMMLAPGVMAPDAKPLPKDVVFVLDTSGSMAGAKIEQARGALNYCVNSLNDGDRFAIIRFSTDVEPLSETLVAADDAGRKRALTFVKDIAARGGTAIDGALAAALKLNFEPTRPGMVVFLTDGKPTVGESDTDVILKHVTGARPGGVRVFVFGVGEAVNTVLLDRLSGENGGVSQYVAPDEDIEVKVSGFADKISNPVLANLRLEVDKLATSKQYPAVLPDLFSGEQLTLLGRYAGEGHVAIRLLGDVNGVAREFVYEETFPALNADNEFVPRLWATRRVGHLLDEIRLHGEQIELKDEVILLSKEYGIMTPYTSYLVLEDEKAYQDHGIAVTRDDRLDNAGQVFARSAAAPSTAPAAESAPADGRRMVPVFEPQAVDSLAKAAANGAGGAGGEGRTRLRVMRSEKRDLDGYLKRESGAQAVELSEAIRHYKERELDRNDIATVRHIGGRVFQLVHERWVDSRYREDMQTTRVEFGGDAYFELVSRHPELKACFALGEKVTIVLDDRHAIVVE